MTSLAFALVACTQLAGLEPSESSTRATSAEQIEYPSEPTTGAVGDEEKANTDSNAEDINVTPLLDFGAVGCGAERTESLVVTNKSDAERRYAIFMPDDAPFRAEGPLEGKIPANGHVVIPVVARPIVSGDATANIVVTSGSSFATVPAGVIGAGAALEWSTASADIGDTPLGTEGTKKVTLRNSGMRAATITGFEGLSTNFDASPRQLTLTPGGEVDVEVILTKGAAATSRLATQLRPIATGVCAPPPPVTVTGQRVDTTVTVSGADWGKQDCNSSDAGERAVVVRNYSNREVRWTLAAMPERFALVGAATGIAPAASGRSPGTANIVFQSPPLGPDPVPVVEPVTVHIESTSGAKLPAPSGGDHVVSLGVDVRGAVLRLDPTELAFTARAKWSTDSQTFKITNTGNEPASLSWKFERTAGGPAWMGFPQSSYTQPGATTTVRISYLPSTAPPNTATLTPSRASGGKICNPDALVGVNMSGSEP